MNLNQGAIYNWYISEQMNKSNEALEDAVRKWQDATIPQKIAYFFNPFVNHEMIYKASRDILEARVNPKSDIANKINWRIEVYRKEKN
jgi:hypothetical protein